MVQRSVAVPVIIIQIFAFLLQLVTVGFGNPAVAVHCPVRINDRIQQCVQPVAQYAKILNQQEVSTNGNNNNGTASSTASSSSHSEFGPALTLPKLGGQVFKELCRLIRNFDDCVKEFRETCPRHITISLIDASYGFLCNEGYDTFMTSAECLMELDQRPTVKQCHDETLADIERTNNELGMAMPAKLDRMCDALNFFSGCVRSPIRQDCGHNAWSVIFRVLRDTTRTLMPACAFTGESTRLQLMNAEKEEEQVNKNATLTTTFSPDESLTPKGNHRRTNEIRPKPTKDSSSSTRRPSKNDDDRTNKIIRVAKQESAGAVAISSKISWLLVICSCLLAVHQIFGSELMP